MEKVILEIDDRTFDSQVLKSDKPVLVDLWAPWCGPCNSIEPVVEKLAEAYGDQIQFARCNVDQNPKTPDKYGVKGIPTLMFFKGGKLVDKVTGLVPMSIIEVDQYIAEQPEEFLEYSDWMGIPIQGYPVTLDRLKSLLVEQARILIDS